MASVSTSPTTSMTPFSELGSVDISRIEQVRQDSEGRMRVFDLIRTIKGIKAKTSNSIAADWTRLRREFPRMTDTCCHSKVKGCRKSQWVCDLKTALEIVWLCKGKRAAAFRRECATKLVQFFNGDPAMLEEWKRNHERATGNQVDMTVTMTTPTAAAAIASNATATLPSEPHEPSEPAHQYGPVAAWQHAFPNVTEEMLAHEQVCRDRFERSLDATNPIYAKWNTDMDNVHQIVEKAQQIADKNRTLFNTRKQLKIEEKQWEKALIEDYRTCLTSKQITDPSKIARLNSRVEEMLFDGFNSSMDILMSMGGALADARVRHPQPAQLTSPAAKLRIREILQLPGIVQILNNRGLDNRCIDFLVANKLSPIGRRTATEFRTKYGRDPDNRPAIDPRFNTINVYGSKDYDLIIGALVRVRNDLRSNA